MAFAVAFDGRNRGSLLAALQCVFALLNERDSMVRFSYALNQTATYGDMISKLPSPAELTRIRPVIERIAARR
jgi:hypothetical protein